MATVLVPLADGFEDIEAVTIIDVLRRGGVTVVTASLGSSTEVKSAHGISLRADAALDDVDGELYDAVVLPGGGEGTRRLRECRELAEILRRHNVEHRLLCAICAAPTVLVAAGVVDPELQLTCYPTCQMELDRSWTPVPVVANGNVITAQAPGTAMLFALVVLQSLAGEPVAAKVARGMVTDVLG